jgi:NAD(P)-dependent dehydrogenase (short-subunit alcohol dehydrogenase family)
MAPYVSRARADFRRLAPILKGGSDVQRYSDRRVLVTGATGGLGEAICARLAAEGAKVAVADLAGAPVAALTESLSGTGHLSLSLDVTQEEQWQAVATDLEARWGGVDVLVNNAGIGSKATVEDEVREEFDRVVAVDQTGVWFGMKHIGPLIERTGTSGAIVNIASILGSTGGLANSFAYAAAKGAVRAMTKNAALYWAQRGVRVNSLHPGFIETAPLLARFAGTQRHAAMLANRSEEHTSELQSLDKISYAVFCV